MKVCPNCHTPARFEAQKFCAVCGHRFEDAGSAPQAQPAAPAEVPGATPEAPQPVERRRPAPAPVNPAPEVPEAPKPVERRRPAPAPVNPAPEVPAAPQPAERRRPAPAPVHPALPAPLTERYRNKVQLPVGTDEDGRLVTGFYAGRSHRIVACRDCRLQPDWMNRLAARACALLQDAGAAAYDEERHTGLVRHLYMRQGWHSGQRLLCFVLNGRALPQERALCETLQREFDLTTVLVNRNTKRTNVILGEETRTVLGPGFIEDTLAGVALRMGVHEFYQVNTPAAEVLYAKARAFAALRPEDFLLDLYCGMGTIGLSMLPDCRRLLGVEIVPQAVEGAQATAARLGLPAERADFRCQDAGAAAAQLAAEGARPDVIVVDPPRKGCDEATLQAIVQMAPRTVVMVSCNAATAARDTRWLVEHGYGAQQVQPVDLFPRTKHVECIVQLQRAAM